MTEHSFMERRYIGIVRDALHKEGFYFTREDFDDQTRVYEGVVRKGGWSGGFRIDFGDRTFRSARQFQTELARVIYRMAELAFDAQHESDMA